VTKPWPLKMLIYQRQQECNKLYANETNLLRTVACLNHDFSYANSSYFQKFKSLEKLPKLLYFTK